MPCAIERGFGRIRSGHHAWQMFPKLRSNLVLLHTERANNRGSDEIKRTEDLVATTKRIVAYSHLGKLDRARQLFDEMQHRDSIAYNIMIREYAQNGKIEDAREIFDGMPRRNTVSWNSMIMAYGMSGKMHFALKLFFVMPEYDRDTITWTTTISGLARDSRISDSWKLFKLMPEPDPASWSAVISGCEQNGLASDTLLLFKQMLLGGTRPNSHSLTTAFAAAACLPALSIGQQLYAQLLKRGFHNNTLVGNSAISMFMKSGSFDGAANIFDSMPEPDLFTWNAMITGYGQHGYGAEAILAFNQMQEAGFRPDGVSLLGVLHGCSHCGFVKRGCLYFEVMQKEFEATPKPEHYVCMVDIFARAGMLKEAADMIVKMPFEPTAVIWRTLLSGCRTFGDVELGAYAVDRALELEPECGATCLMVIEMYGTVGRQAEVVTMRKLLRDRQMMKELACSWIEIRGNTHLFASRDETHPESSSIYMMVELLAGAVAESDECRNICSRSYNN